MQNRHWGCSVRYRFVFAAILASLALAPIASHAQDAALTQQLSACKPPKGAVLVSPETPHTTIKVFCADELKRLDCQILSQIRNYIFYSYGRCESNSDMFMQTFVRPACSQVKDIDEYNKKVDRAIPDEVWSFIRTIRRTEADKGCLSNNLIVD
jgi:hypothetical protein